jgi:hypothetical protein
MKLPRTLFPTRNYEEHARVGDHNHEDVTLLNNRKKHSRKQPELKEKKKNKKQTCDGPKSRPH